ncbi:NAC domain-containing protein 35-like isoform X2 [Camellia sinensis]|uniref:NAC domain-containing protein 35-like isoform X2 n=1 Tax=Camellia sinensis TaxID=4442 RepID=UPI0010365E78|nr:NAC domain-containing protein 35-like isoform X2 [Camellia sinensis]
MAIAATTMSQDDNSKDDHDQHDHDMVMPGFRFHPTEEELIEFYLRRKVEGKRFNVELITFLDLYRYDPWELPALAAIGEKEWFFYVPRDRKYRNGDRPNRVTTSGYWKATGADRMIRSENFRSIGLKKTLVFYSGKAPKGIRTSWIMNEYRLPHHETERLQKAEISLCRVYKRAGVEDHPSLPRSLPTKASSSRTTQSDKKQHCATNQTSIERFQAFVGHSQVEDTEKMSETSGGSCSGSGSGDIGTALGLSKQNSYIALASLASPPVAPPPARVEDDRVLISKQACPLVQNCSTVFTGTSLLPQNPVDDFHRLLNFQQSSISQYHTHHQYHASQFSTFQPQSQSLPPFNMLPGPVSLPATTAAAFSDRLWEWNSITEGNKDYTSPFNFRNWKSSMRRT